MIDKLLIVAYSIFLLAGGFIGWSKAGSKISLIMGVVSSGLVFIGLYLISVNAKTAYLLLTLTGFILSAVFIMRLMKTQKFMPSGMLLTLSILFLIFCILKINKLG